MVAEKNTEFRVNFLCTRAVPKLGTEVSEV